MTFQTIRTEGVKHINYSKSIESNQKQIAPLLLITIIENAFKHSTLNSDISVSITENNGILECVCLNDYDKNKVSTEDFKIGLQNLEKRLKLIYKDDYKLEITKAEMYKVYLKLKLE